MPFKSEAQRRFMHAKHPEIAERWEHESPPGKLPDHKSKLDDEIAEMVHHRLMRDGRKGRRG